MRVKEEPQAISLDTVESVHVHVSPSTERPWIVSDFSLSSSQTKITARLVAQTALSCTAMAAHDRFIYGVSIRHWTHKTFQKTAGSVPLVSFAKSV